MPTFKSYDHAVKAGYQPSMDPYDEPDMPELEDIDRDCYLSRCCHEKVNDTINGCYICDDCGLFCKIDEDASVELYLNEDEL